MKSSPFRKRTKHKNVYVSIEQKKKKQIIEWLLSEKFMCIQESPLRVHYSLNGQWNI